jgi:ferredoxin
MSWFKKSIAAIFLAIVTAAFFNVPLSGWAPKLQATASALSFADAFSAGGFSLLKCTAFIVVLALTLVLGRFYCEVMCPLGIVQSFVDWLFRRKRSVRRVCTRLSENRAQRIVRLSVLAVAVVLCAVGLWPLAWMLDPYAVYGRMIAFTVPFAFMGIAIVVLAACGKGRFWCNWICPLGTLFSFVARFSLFKNKIGPGCANCRACFGNCGEGKVRSETKGTQAPEATRRDSLKAFALLAAAEKFGDGGFADVTPPGRPNRPVAVMPPGAGRREDFSRKCISCHICVSNCPEKVLRPSLSLKSFGQPEMDFRNGYCLLSCTRCSNICPSGALMPLQPEMRPNVRMGVATFDHKICVRTVNGDKCDACARKCPVKAISFVKEYPVVDELKCVGCGACEHVCPARPSPAVFVKGYDMQRMVLPMSEADLLLEMKRLVAEGRSIVVARGGVISGSSDKRGVVPALEMLDSGKLKGALVVDKIVGRAAAAAFVAGGVKKVYATVMSAGAKALLEKNGIEAGADKTVETIINRDKTGMCPMENAVKDIHDADVEKMVETLRKAIKK